MNGFAGWKIREPPLHSDLVTLKNPRITLDRLHQRAGFCLLGSRALAKAAAGQSCPEGCDRQGGSREVMPRKIVGVHRQIGLDPLKLGDDTGERAHMLSKARDGRPRRHGPESAPPLLSLWSGPRLPRCCVSR